MPNVEPSKKDPRQDPRLTALEEKAKALKDKLKKLQARELIAEEMEGDGRQEEAIVRNEKFLRDVLKEAEKIKKA